MKLVAIDTETFLLNTSGKATTKTVPRLVCLSIAEEGGTPGLYERERAVHVAKALVERDDVILVGHNMAFDVLVLVRAVREELGVDLLPRFFELYNAGRIRDTMVREKVYDISQGGLFRRGGYGLKDLVKRMLKETVKGKSGKDAWRMRYNELDGVHVSKYPAAAYEYAILDAVFTLRVYKHRDFVLNEDFQATASFCLALISAWGVRIDAEWATEVDAYYARQENELLADLVASGLADPSGKVPTKRKQALVADGFASLGIPTPLTPTGGVATNKKAIAELKEGLLQAGFDFEQDKEDEGWFSQFVALMAYNRARKFRTTYLEPMLDASDADAPLCARYNEVVDSWRTSSSNPNLQNIVSRLNPSEKEQLAAFQEMLGDKKLTPLERMRHPAGFVVGPDIRGCIVARPGKVIVGADYKAAEMGGLAQVLANWKGEVTALGESINAGEDQHLRIVAAMRGIPYAETVRLYDDYKAAEEEGRQPEDPTIDFDRFTGKSANFGFAGGSSAETWVEFCASMGAKVTLATAQKVKAAWFTAWPEMNFYRDMVSSLQLPGGEYHCDCHGPNGQTSGWGVRIAPRYTSAMNHFFQNIVSSGCKYALWLLQRACFLDEDSPLFGSRILIFEHDAFYLECDEDKADAVGEELTVKMIEGMSLFTPDIEVYADYKVLGERWSS